MHITRRNFLHTISAALAVTAVGAGSKTAFGQGATSELFPLPVEIYSQPIYSMKASQFEALIGHQFAAVSSEGRSVSLVLSEVNPIQRLSNATRGSYGESFALVFETRMKERLTQDTYEIRGRGLEPFSALLVPTDRLRKRYELIVNHLSR